MNDNKLVQIGRKTEYTKIVDNNPFQTTTKMFYHTDRLNEWLTTGNCSPISIEIFPIDVCGLACHFCVSMYSHVGNPAMSSEEKKNKLSIVNSNFSPPNGRDIRKGLDIFYLKKFLKEARDSGLKAVVFSGGGDPGIFPDIVEAIEYTAELGLDQGMMTSGFFSTKNLIPTMGKYLRWVRFSVDTYNREKYKSIKVTDGLPKVLSNIKQLIEYRDNSKWNKIKIGLNMNIGQYNHDEIISFAENSRDLGADYTQYRPILQLPFETRHNNEFRTPLGEDLLKKIDPMLLEAENLSDKNFQVMVSWDKMQDIRDFDGNFGRNYTACEGHFFSCILGSDGRLQNCGYFLGNDDFTFGNIYQNSFQEIWQSEKRKKVIEMLRYNLDLSKCQVSCRLHQANKMLHLIKNPKEDLDINFV